MTVHKFPHVYHLSKFGAQLVDLYAPHLKSTKQFGEFAHHEGSKLFNLLFKKNKNNGALVDLLQQFSTTHGWSFSEGTVSRLHLENPEFVQGFQELVDLETQTYFDKQRGLHDVVQCEPLTNVDQNGQGVYGSFSTFGHEPLVQVQDLSDSLDPFTEKQFVLRPVVLKTFKSQPVVFDLTTKEEGNVAKVKYLLFTASKGLEKNVNKEILGGLAAVENKTVVDSVAAALERYLTPFELHHHGRQVSKYFYPHSVVVPADYDRNSLPADLKPVVVPKHVFEARFPEYSAVVVPTRFGNLYHGQSGLGVHVELVKLPRPGQEHCFDYGVQLVQQFVFGLRHPETVLFVKK